MAKDGKVFEIKTVAGTSTIVGSEIIRPYKQMFFGENLLIANGLIKFKEEAGSIIRVPAAIRLLSKVLPATTNTALTLDSVAQAENKLLVDKATDGFFGGMMVNSLDTSLYLKTGEVNAIAMKTLAKTGFNIAELRWFVEFRKQIITGTSQPQQIILTTDEITAATQEKGADLLKKISDAINTFVKTTNKFTETVPRNQLYFFVAPDLFSALKRTYTLSVRQTASTLTAVGDTVNLDGVNIIEYPLFLFKNVVAEMFDKVATVDLSKVYGLVVSKRFIDSFIWDITMTEEIIPQTGGNRSNILKGMSKSQVFEEFKLECTAFVSSKFSS